MNKENQKENFMQEYLKRLRKLKANMKAQDNLVEIHTGEITEESVDDCYKEINRQIKFLEDLLGDVNE